LCVYCVKSGKPLDRIASWLLGEQSAAMRRENHGCRIELGSQLGRRLTANIMLDIHPVESSCEWAISRYQ
jgi:hypothetical protein